jgi:cytochrome P450
MHENKTMKGIMMQATTSKDELFASYEWYRTMRATQPVSYDKERYSWNVFRYEDVVRVLSEQETFSSDPHTVQPHLTGDEDSMLSSLLLMDPPRHRQLRSLVNLAFTPRMIAQLEPRIRAITNELLDQVIAKGEMDVVKDLTYPLPVIVIAELLGVPAEKRADFKRWSDISVATAGPRFLFDEETQRLMDENEREMREYFDQIFEERRQHPQNDLISRLLAAEIDGQRLSPNELNGFCVLLLVAGNETTTNLIANSVLCFDRNPGVVERLRNNPTLLPSAIEESLRYLSPVKRMGRFTKTETTIGGQLIGAHQAVAAWIGSANRDEAQFPDPDRFDIERTPNRHIAFGHGIHFCLGAPLARLEAKIALTAMLERCPGAWHVSDVPLEPVQGLAMFGVKNLLMTWG